MRLRGEGTEMQQKPLAVTLGAISLFVLTSLGCSGSGDSIDKFSKDLDKLEGRLRGMPNDLRLCLNYARVCERINYFCLDAETEQDIEGCNTISMRCEAGLGLFCSRQVGDGGMSDASRDAGRQPDAQRRDAQIDG